MKISIIGCGYVGSVTGAGFARFGNEVLLVDFDPKKISSINSGKSPIYENGLEDLIKKHKSNLEATSEYEYAIKNSDITFFCVGTPTSDDGKMDTKYIVSAARSLGECLKNKDSYHVVVVKSTVLPGTTESLVAPIIEETSQKKAYKDFGIAMNPEFLREGCAVGDFLNPDRIVIGANDPRTQAILEKLYEPFNCKKVVTKIKAAEMIKYTSNAFLATKISFANEIGNLCKKMEIDSYEVFEGAGMDKRINPHFFNAGIGFGGSCFPKDVKALLSKATEIEEESPILKAVLKVNDEQPGKLIRLLKKHVKPLKNKRIGILGLAFKPETDDIREARAIPIIEELLHEEAEIIAYDPRAMDNFRKEFPTLTYAQCPEDVLNADAVLILTEWDEFEHLDYQNKIVIDGRRIRSAMEKAAVYDGVCW